MSELIRERFDKPADEFAAKFVASIEADANLVEQDIRGSRAHAAMLAERGILTPEENAAIAKGLDQVAAEWRAGTLKLTVANEDVHMNVEKRLIEIVGHAAGAKLHTARSRNDQVATDLRLWVRHALDKIDSRLLDLQRAFVDRSDADFDVVLPAYTHLQRAQPVLAPHYWLAYCEKFERDRQRVRDCRRRVNVCTLGTAAVAGTSLTTVPTRRS